MPRSIHGGRHELGQNFLHHRPTIAKITALVAETRGPILEIGAGAGALTYPLSRLGRDLTAIEIDEHRVRSLRRSLSSANIRKADVLTYPLTAPVIVGSIPFHITTQILRRLLAADAWQHSVLLTQWEVARRRAGVGGTTMMTAQAAPWFSFRLCGRVPSWGFTPRPSVDGGILVIERRETELVPVAQRKAYERFVKQVFTGRGNGLRQILQRTTGASRAVTANAMATAGLRPQSLPRDVNPDQWATLWYNSTR